MTAANFDFQRRKSDLLCYGLMLARDHSKLWCLVMIKDVWIYFKKLV